MTEIELRRIHARPLKLTANKMPSPEQAGGCVTCIACLAWPAVVFWPISKFWSICCFCNINRSAEAGTHAEVVAAWNDLNRREPI